MDVGTVITSLLGSSVIATGLSGLVSRLSQRHQEDREDRATRRLVRSVARDLSTQILLLRQYGFAHIESLTAARSALKDLLSQRDVLKALTDEESSALEEAVRNSDSLLYHVTEAYGDPGKPHTPSDLEQTQLNLREAAGPTFRPLRRFFELDKATETLTDFDKAEKGREEYMRTRFGAHTP